MKTESNIRPASQFEIEALPPIEGRSCTVILYDNIQGPFTRQASGEDQEPQEYFTFDRYTVDTIYREGLAAAVAADTETWIQNAKEAEASGEQPSELEILTKTVTKQGGHQAALFYLGGMQRWQSQRNSRDSSKT